MTYQDDTLQDTVRSDSPVAVTTHLMSRLKNGITNLIADELAIPRRVRMMLEATPQLKVIPRSTSQSIAIRDVERWDDIVRPGYGLHARRESITGYAMAHDGYRSVSVVRPELGALVSTTTRDWECDIRQVEGLMASKGDIEKFRDMDIFIEHAYPALIQDVSEHALQRNLQHREIRVDYEGKSDDRPSCDGFWRFGWDDRIFLMQSGGSHHFAAARFIAGRLGRPLRLRGELKQFNLNASAVMALTRDYDIFAVSDDQVHLAFHDAMKAYRARYYRYGYPAPHTNICMLLLPRAERRSTQVAQLLRDRGFCDVGQHWLALLNK